jgi:DNA modification methylase
MSALFPETGVLYRDDCRDRLATFEAESVDLVYMDPPFFSNRSYEVIWGDESEVRSFEDRWDGGISVYVDWMRERLIQVRRVLRQGGSLYLHCDPHASHYLKTLLDDIFGSEHFLSEIIWRRTNAHSSAKRWAPIHDVILYYGRGKPVTWNTPRKEYEDDYLDRYYKYDDGDGRLYWRADLCAAGVRNGRSGVPWRGFDPAGKGMHWKFTVERLEELDKEGRIYWPPRGTGWPQYKRYRSELQGVAVGDFWDDIDKINPVAKERLGYPTQKPEALLERIIAASSNEGDIVLDPFCGCGTSVAVAQKLRRRWIGIDISNTAIAVMKRRMEILRVYPKIINEPDTLLDLKQLKPLEFQNWVINTINGVHSRRQSGDMGIDGYTFLTAEPVQIKQSDRIGRNVVDNFETAVRRAGHDTGHIIAFSFSRGAREEAARAKQDGLNIRLVTVAEVLLLRKRPHGRLFPLPEDVASAPILDIRKKTELPSANQLIESERRWKSA